MLNKRLTIMISMPTLLGTYLIGFIVFYLFEIQDTEKFSQIYISRLDRYVSNREQQRAKHIYTLIVLIGSLVWPVWMIRQLIQMSSIE